MSASDATHGGKTASPGWFTTTHWSLVLAAGDGPTAISQAALEKLCRSYWYPLYAYVRRRGYSPEDAQDATQGFFTRLLEKNSVAHVSRDKGKFRSFLLTSMNNFLRDQWDKASAQKRGGGQAILSLDATDGEDRYQFEPVDHVDAEQLFDRRWALTILEQAKTRLKQECTENGTTRLYERVNPTESTDKHAPPYSAIAAELGMSESNVKTSVFRMRQRYRELVRDEVANTVETQSEIDGEIRYLISVISR
jgi:RNA polymerase sigma-70 factor (ECF subfamily)